MGMYGSPHGGRGNLAGALRIRRIDTRGGPDHDERGHWGPFGAGGGKLNEKPDIGRLFWGLKPRSQHSVKTAIEAALIEGLTGTLIIQISASVDKPTEVYFTNADLKLIPAVGIQ